MSLLPSHDDPDGEQSGALRVVDVDDERADAVFEALASETTRAILAAVHREPSTPSELAERADTTVQNAMYHIEKLREADLLRVADTRYSSRGKEMRVYAPAENPTVVFVGTDERRDGLLTRLKRLLGGLAVIVAAVAALRNALPSPDTLGTLTDVPNPGRSLTALAAGAALFVVSRVTRERDARPMQRKTLLLTAALVLSAALTPAAIAYSPAVSGEYYASDAPASGVGVDSAAGPPDLRGETVHVAVRGGSEDLRAALREDLAGEFGARGATVERADSLDGAESNLFVVSLPTARVEPGGLTPTANLTVTYAFSAAGNTTAVRSGLDAAARDELAPWGLRTDEPKTTAGWFQYDRGERGLMTALNTVKRAGVNPSDYRDEVATDVANASVSSALDNWG
jgi:DNA-binding transcriptional ArsR family regulator